MLSSGGFRDSAGLVVVHAPSLGESIRAELVEGLFGNFRARHRGQSRSPVKVRRGSRTPSSLSSSASMARSSALSSERR
jgi:hypothetical protein